MSKELLGALDTLESEKGIKKEVVIEALEAALVSAYKRNYGQAQNVEVDFDQIKGNIHVYAVKVIMQRVREAERGIIYDEYSQYENEIVTGEVERQDNRFVYVSLGKVEAVMGRSDQLPGEVYRIHDKIKVYVSKVENATKGPQVFVSRTAPDLLKRLFEQEVPEIFDGIVEIVSIAREAGDRAKVAVRSNNPNVDPVGTCVGPKGQRVQTIVNELHGENMDIVEWTDDQAVFIANALNPAEVLDVIFDPENERGCTVVVPDYQLSLAIGKRGQNARLAAKLTGFKIDIKSETEASDIMDANPDDVAVAETETTEAASDAAVQSDTGEDEEPATSDAAVATPASETAVDESASDAE
ncbi:MAG: transcription termination factor NusA [Lactiplantibacillus plantarum]|nr:transcription termination factor NusA [Lactiplantibacillus plantarum]